MEHVEKWCRKRKYCWTLPVSVFTPAVKYDNFFRCMICFYSRQWIERQNAIKRYFYYGKITQQMRLATLKDVVCWEKEFGNDWGSLRMTTLSLVPIDGDFNNLDMYYFKEEDLSWSRKEYNGWSFLPYDMDIVLLKIAYLQASCFGLPRVITQLIAQFAKETLTRKDRCKDGKSEKRNFAIRTKRKHLEAIL